MTSSTIPAQPFCALVPATTAAKPRRAFAFVCALLVTLTTAFAQAQHYSSIVSFGDSLSDTGNVAALTQAKYGIRIPGPLADYTDGRFTDGTDTIPAAHEYHGVWLEQFAAFLHSRPNVVNSLNGGTNYAYGFAFTGNGTSNLTFGPGNSLSVNVDNVGLQITHYLATSPKIHENTLFVVWGGANDVLNATSTNEVANAAVQQAFNVQRLVDAGARNILVLNLPPLGSIPRLNMTPYSAYFTQATILYNQTLAAGLAVLKQFGKHEDDDIRISQLDIFALFQKVLANPVKYALANVTGSSQGNYVINPDTYLFWDSLHPTTRGHNIIAQSALGLLNPEACEALATDKSLCGHHSDDHHEH